MWIKLQNSMPRIIKKAINNPLFCGSAVYLLSNIISAGIPFALMPILTHYLSTREYGQVAIFQTLLAGLGAFVGINVQAAASVKYFDQNISKNEIGNYIGHCLLVLGFTAIVLFLITLFFLNSLSIWLATEIQWILLAFLVSSASFVISMRLGQWQVRKQAKHFAIFQVSQSLVNMLLSVLAVVFFLQGANGRIWILIVVPLIFSLIALISLYKDDLLDFAWSPNKMREILSFGVPLIPHSVGLFLLSSVDRFIVNDKLGLEQVGIYMVAVQMVAVMGLVFDAINNAYAPWLFERLQRNLLEEKKLIVFWTYIYIMALLSIVILVFFVAESLVHLIAGEKYIEASEIIGWLALGQAFQGMYLMVTNYIFYSKRTGLLSLSTIISGLIHVSLLIALVSLIGLKGAAIAFAISMALKFLMTWFVAQLRHPMPWFNFIRSSKSV